MKIPNEFKVGLLTLISILLLYFGYQFLKGDSNFFEDEIIVFAEYSNVEGITNGDLIQINGYTVGRVGEIDLIDIEKGRIKANFILSNKHEISIHTKAQISNSGFMGEKVIKLIAMDSVAIMNSGILDRPLKTGDRLYGTVQPALATAIREELVPMKIKVEKLLQSVDESLDVVAQLLNEENKKKINAGFSSMQAAAIEFKDRSIMIDSVVLEQSKTTQISINKLDSVTQGIKDNNKKITALLDTSALITKKLSEKDIKASVSNASDALGEFSVVMKDLNDENGPYSNLFEHDSMYNNILNATVKLDSILEDIRTHPDRYIRFSGGDDKDENDNKN